MKTILRKLPTGTTMVTLVIQDGKKQETISLDKGDKNYWRAFYGQSGDEVEYSLDNNGGVINFDNLSFEAEEKK